MHHCKLLLVAIETRHAAGKNNNNNNNNKHTSKN